MGIPAHIARPAQGTRKDLALGRGAQARVPPACAGRCRRLTRLLLSAEGPWTGAADRVPVSRYVRCCPRSVSVCVHRPGRDPLRVCVWLLPRFSGRMWLAVSRCGYHPGTTLFAGANRWRIRSGRSPPVGPSAPASGSAIHSGCPRLIPISSSRHLARNGDSWAYLQCLHSMPPWFGLAFASRSVLAPITISSSRSDSPWPLLSRSY